MREDNAANPLAVLDQVGDVGDHNVDPEQFSFGEHEPGVDYDNIVVPADRHAVHTELAEAPQGDNLQFSSWHGVLMMLAECVTYRTERFCRFSSAADGIPSLSELRLSKVEHGGCGIQVVASSACRKGPGGAKDQRHIVGA